MADKMRWRYGETNPVMMPVATGLVIEIGDLVYLDTDVLRPASSQTDQGTLAANQELFHDNFLGVAMQHSPSDSSAAIRVATTGVFEFDCLSATFEIGDLIGSTEDPLGTELESQFVEQVAAENLAVGRCVKRIETAGTNVLVDIVSTVVRGGPQVAA